MEIECRHLEKSHTREAILERLNVATEHSNLGDFVFGGIEGVVTTFAVVAGSAGDGIVARSGEALHIAHHPKG